MKADFVVDLSFGDCGKAKVTLDLLKKNKYTHTFRGNGGNNAGHTIYHDGKKIITHGVPTGVIFGLKSLIGPCCVINVKSLFEEMNELEALGFNPHKLVRIAKNAHIITEDHILEEQNESRIGTTKKGIGGAYRDKASRTGIRAESIPELAPYLIDFHEEIFNESDGENILLFEGAQGMYLDVDHAKYYPYNTSSSCTVAGALLNGIPHTAVRDVYGVIKPYETYVGAMKFEGSDPVFEEIRKCGGEVGATTGRPRQVNFLNTLDLHKAISINAVNILIINKMDVLQQVNCWKVRDNSGTVTDLKTEENFKSYLQDLFPGVKMMFSYSPHHI